MRGLPLLLVAGLLGGCFGGVEPVSPSEEPVEEPSPTAGADGEGRKGAYGASIAPGDGAVEDTGDCDPAKIFDGKLEANGVMSDSESVVLGTACNLALTMEIDSSLGSFALTLSGKDGEVFEWSPTTIAIASQGSDAGTHEIDGVPAGEYELRLDTDTMASVIVVVDAAP